MPTPPRPARRGPLRWDTLDVAIPPPDGLEVCQRIREMSAVPILMLTARGHTLDKVRALDLDADDYVTKPFDHLELLAVGRPDRCGGVALHGAGEIRAPQRGRSPLKVDAKPGGPHARCVAPADDGASKCAGGA